MEQRKIIISQVVSRIELGKEYKLKVTINMEYEQFCEGWNGLDRGITVEV